MNDLLAYIWLAHFFSLNRRAKKFLIEYFGGARAVFDASDHELTNGIAAYEEQSGRRSPNVSLPSRDLADARTCLQLAKSMGAQVIHYESAVYPDALREIPDPPALLYTLGDASLLARSSVAVVGTRRASPYGRWAAYEISAKISSCGTQVISGLAEGIDTEAHKGCLNGGSGTIAVLGTGIGHCFPASNRALHRAICSCGLVVSEFYPTDKGFASYFPLRNRIISGLSRAVIVVEGALKSGSMITAGLALEQGKDVYAVPGNINQPNSEGVNRLIYDGAYPILSLDTVPKALGILTPKQQEARESLSKEELLIFNVVKKNGMQSLQELCDATNLSPSDVASLTTILELKGFLSKRGTKIEVAK